MIREQSIARAAAGQAVLTDLRKIIRANDLRSKKLQSRTGLTTPQAVVIRAIKALGEVTTREISENASLSQATVTTILDRLEAKGLIERYRSLKDRRVVHARLTAKGKSVERALPKLLDEEFDAAFSTLSERRQKEISSAIALIAQMMTAGGLDAAPAETKARAAKAAQPAL